MIEIQCIAEKLKPPKIFIRYLDSNLSPTNKSHALSLYRAAKFLQVVLV